MIYENGNKPRLMSPKEVASATTLSRTLITLMSKAGEFPKPVKLGIKRIAWIRDEVESFIDQRIARRAS